jgi:DNA-binding MarR family transcriptional regulator
MLLHLHLSVKQVFRYAYDMAAKKCPCPQSIRAWTSLVRAESAVLTAVETDLKQAGFPSLAWYEILQELDHAGSEGLRPFELEAKISVRQYNLSRLLARLADEDLIEKRQCQGDGRGHHVRITATGRSMKNKMWPAYADAIDKHFSGKLAMGEAAQLAGILDKVLG